MLQFVRVCARPLEIGRAESMVSKNSVIPLLGLLAALSMLTACNSSPKQSGSRPICSQTLRLDTLESSEQHSGIQLFCDDSRTTDIDAGSVQATLSYLNPLSADETVRLSVPVSQEGVIGLDPINLGRHGACMMAGRLM